MLAEATRARIAQPLRIAFRTAQTDSGFHKNEARAPEPHPSAHGGVNEFYMELVKLRGLQDRGYSDEEEKAAFIRLAGQMMDRLLIHHALPARRAERVDLEAIDAGGGSSTESLQHVENALAKLEAIDPRVRAVVEMKVFEGMTGEEIARRLGCSARTVAACWTFARDWLQTRWTR